ncbi:MAG: LytR C-terminal domain-containing protein [Fusobacterium sp.]|nr:LytR C-terminal domain-containing protein [Fusobacterium sp.]
MAKSKKKIKRGRAKVIVLFLILLLLFLLFLNFRGSTVELAKNEKALVIGKENLFAVYEDKLAVKIPFEVNINNEETVKDLVDSKNYENLLEKVNGIMPEKMDKFIVLNSDKLNLEVENKKNIPETNIDDKRIILSSSIYSMFNESYSKKNDAVELNGSILVDVLNANGRGGYARRTGELLKKDLGVKYNAANYEKKLNESYVILNDISKEKALEIVEKLPEKYFKIKSKSTIPTLANLVVVLGKENEIDFKIKVFTDKDKYSDVSKKVKKIGYSDVIRKDDKIDTQESIIKYNKEDYFTAQKIAKALDIKNIIEASSLKNEIEIIVK